MSQAQKPSRLRAADREHLALVSEAAFENPFSARRIALDARLAQSAEKDSRWVARMLERLSARLRDVFRGGEAPAWSQEDRTLIEYAVFFEAYHRFVDEIDAHIEREEAAGASALRVGFAGELLRQITARGIAPEHAHRMFELFYQMRRAYYFIDRGLIGESASMGTLRQTLWDAIFTHQIRNYERYLWNRMEDFSTILIGETGSGKGAAAAAIGRSGFIAFDAKKSAFAHGFRKSFVPINLNEFPEALFESEIFGHRKGAFTGAIEDHEGVLASCPEHGTVFFDEIGEATLPVQVKLLRVLQERTFTPVGSRKPQRFSGRILAATHRSLAELRERGALRDDFYYRLCSNVIEVPPLRARIAESAGELPMLVEHLCTRIAGAEARGLSAEVTRKLERDLGKGYAFPGNVRELEQAVRRVFLTGGCAPDRKPALAEDRALAAELMGGTLTAEALTARYCALLYAQNPSYVDVARRTGLDRRTVKKHVDAARG
jgi:DNA-binding NtrC family response regulator